MGDPIINVVLAGGLGMSQLSTMRSRLGREQSIVATWAGDTNAYDQDLGRLGIGSRLKFNVLVTHSFAGIPGLKAREYYSVFDKIFSLDPVSCYPGVSSWELSDGFGEFIWIPRKNPGILPFLGIETPLKITGDVTPQPFDDSHNGLPNNPVLIESVVSRILQLGAAGSSSASTAPPPQGAAQSQGGA